MDSLFGDTGTRPSSSGYRLIQSVEELQQYARTLYDLPAIAIDTETSGLRPYLGDYLGGISLSRGPGDGAYIPLRHKDSRNLPIESVREILNPVLLSPTIRKRGYHTKFDAHFLSEAGFQLDFSSLDCGLIMLFLLDETIIDKSLKGVASWMVHPNADWFAKDLHRLLTQFRTENWIDLPATAIYQYACADADYTFQVDDKLTQQINSQSHLRDLYQSEQEMIEVLFNMERLGVEIDTVELAELHKNMERELVQLKHEIYRHAGHPFSITSDEEIQKVLFTELGLPIVYRTPKTHAPATDKRTLKKLEGLHPIVPAIRRFRAMEKLFGTYVTGTENNLTTDNRIHTSYNQHKAKTGRLSSSGPNLQNIPARNKAIRRIFSSPANKEFIQLFIDQEQIELVVAAHYSGEPSWVEAFREGRDLHAQLCIKIFKVPAEEFQKHPVPDYAQEKRRLIKPYNFGELYGLEEEGIQEYLEGWDVFLSADECKQIHKDWWTAVPYIKAARDVSIKSCRKHGYVQSLLGRVRHLPDINSSVEYKRERAERQCFNFLIQGSCADMLKIAMRRCHKFLKQHQTTMRMTIHDETVFYQHRDEIADVVPALQFFMSDFPFLNVPVRAKVDWSDTNWAEKKAA